MIKDGVALDFYFRMMGTRECVTDCLPYLFTSFIFIIILYIYILKKGKKKSRYMLVNGFNNY